MRWATDGALSQCGSPSRLGPRVGHVRIARYTTGEDPAYGVVEGGPGNEVVLALQGDPLYIGLVPGDGEIPLEEVRLLAPVIPRSKVIGIGRNYADHAREIGIGRSRSSSVLNEAGVNLDTRVKDLNEDELSRIRAVLEAQGEIEGDLRKRIQMDIKRLMDIGCYRGLRHRRAFRSVVNEHTPMLAPARDHAAPRSPRRRRQARSSITILDCRFRWLSQANANQNRDNWKLKEIWQKRRKEKSLS